MLLPSALPCGVEARLPLPNLRLPPSRFAPVLPPRSPAPPATSLFSSCRALQALLGSASVTQKPTSPGLVDQSQRLQSPLHARPLATRPIKVIKPKAKSAPPRGANKRRRHEYEGDEDVASLKNVDEGYLKPFSTPKRQRRVPLNMPLGLSAEDFAGLETPPSSDWESSKGDSSQREAQDNRTTPNDLALAGWTPQDDDQLVGLVLEKFKLSRKQWTECARKIGKDDHSVGQRWKLLVGEGDVGLRRGGKRARAQICEDWREEKSSVCPV